MFKGLLHAAHLAMQIGQKLLELHNKGVSKAIRDEIHNAVKEVHDVIDKHHMAVKDKQQEDAALERILDKEDAE